VKGIDTTGRLVPAWLLTFAILVLIFYAPVGFMLIKGFIGTDGHFTVSYIRDILVDPYYRGIFGFTLLQATASTIVSIFLALPLSFLMARYRFKGKSILRALTLVPFVLPSILVALGFVIAYGNNGFLNRFLMSVFHRDSPPLRILYSFKAIILAHSFYNFPVALRIIASSWESIPRSNYDAAETLGGKGFTLFRTVTLPHLIPSILSSAILIFLYCFGSFAVILVLGGGPRFTTLEVEMFNLMRVELDMGKAGALAFIRTIFSLLLLYLHMVARERTTAEKKGEPVPLKSLSSTGPIFKSIVYAYLIFIVIFVVLPLASIFARSLSGVRNPISFPSLEAYRSLFSGGATTETIVGAIRNSLIYGGATVCIAVPLGIAVSYISVRSSFGKSFETLAMLPIAVSSMVFALGYVLIRSRFRLSGFPASALFIVLAHSIAAYPFVARTLSSGLAAIGPSYRQAACSLGAGPVTAFITVELPLLSRAITSGAAFAFALSIGEFNASLLLSEPFQSTIPVAIYRLVSAYNFSGACVLGSILILLCIIAFFLIDRFKGKEEAL